MPDPQHIQNQPRIGATDRLGFTMFLALAVHAIVVLGVGFTQTKKPDSNALPSLDIILANSRSLEPVENPDFLSQVDQAGGGDLSTRKVWQTRPGPNYGKVSYKSMTCISSTNSNPTLK
jgi:protein TonB